MALELLCASRVCARSSLASTQLSGSIPSSMGSLSAMQSFYLQNNSFSGELPGSLGSLTGMRYLYLQNNSFSGTIPSSMSVLTAVQSLLLANSGLCGAVPMSRQPDDGALPACASPPPPPLPPSPPPPSPPPPQPLPDSVTLSTAIPAAPQYLSLNISASFASDVTFSSSGIIMCGVASPGCGATTAVLSTSDTQNSTVATWLFICMSSDCYMKLARIRVVSVASGVAVYQDGTGFVELSCRGGGFSSDMTSANINAAWNSALYLTTTEPPTGFRYQICASTAATTYNNIAPQGTATSSSVYNSDAQPSNAIDNLLYTDGSLTGNTCYKLASPWNGLFETSGTGGWWMLDLGATYAVKFVTLWGRANYAAGSSGLNVFAGASGANGGQANAQCGSAVNAPPSSVNVTCAISARYVTVVQPSNTAGLGLCQVQVWV